jgi:hypothetical protein
VKLVNIHGEKIKEFLLFMNQTMTHRVRNDGNGRKIFVISG